MKWYPWPPQPPERHTAQRRGQGVEPGRIGTVALFTQHLLSLYFTQFVTMSPNPAPFVVRNITDVYITTCNPQHPVANVIVDGSSPFTRSLTTADSNSQPLFILRMGRELGRFEIDLGVWLFCQQLTANAYPRLTFGTISGTGAVFLAPNMALEFVRCFAPSVVQLAFPCKHRHALS
jgi:hypothetical protein